MIIAKEEDFYKKLGKGYVLALFYANWCPFCRSIKPVFESYEDKAPIPLAEVDISDEGKIWDELSINYVPTLILFKDGKIIARRDSKKGVGLEEKDIVALIEEAFKITSTKES